MAQYGFGLGQATLQPSTANSTPLPMAVLKDINVEVSFDLKRLTGSSAFPVDVARGPGKITGKAKFGQIRGALLASVLAGAVSTAGATYGVLNQSTGIIASGSVDTGVVLANFVDDLGVVDDTGTPMTKVAAAPAVGQYQVDTTTGPNVLYKFNVGANGKVYTYSYARKDGLTTSTTVAYTNPLMGQSTTYQLSLYNTYKSKNLGIKLYAVTIPKLSLALKQDDYLDQDIDFEAFADATGKVIDLYVSE